jgi:hypothetical protein
MTGEALYVKFTKACKAVDERGMWNARTELPGTTKRRTIYANETETNVRPVAWPYLTQHDKAVWNEMAKRMTTRKSR